MTSFHSSSSSVDVSARRYRYNGKERDEETGLYYYGARYYAAWLGRWTAVDPGQPVVPSVVGAFESYQKASATSGSAKAGASVDTYFYSLQAITQVVGFFGGGGKIGEEASGAEGGWLGRLIEDESGGIGKKPATSIVRVGQFINTLDDVLANPNLLQGGLEPADLKLRVGGRFPRGWREETLGRGSHKGQGWVLREYGSSGNPTGRQLRWHPGGGRHGPGAYWRVIDFNKNSGIIR